MSSYHSSPELLWQGTEVTGISFSLLLSCLLSVLQNIECSEFLESLMDITLNMNHREEFLLIKKVVMYRKSFYQTLNELEHHFSNINRTQTCSSTFKLFLQFDVILRAVSFLLSTTFCDRVSHLVRSGLNSFPSRSVVRWFQLSMIRIPPAGGIVNPVKIFPDLACCFSTGKTGKKCNYHQVFTSSFASIVLTKLSICHTKSEKKA